MVVGPSGLGLVDLELESEFAERFCELALVFLLFSDSTRIDLAGLRRNLAWPSRLLLVCLPLTMLAGLGAGLLVFPGHRAGQRLRALDDAVLDRRGARTARRVRRGRARARAPGARRRERSQRRPGRPVLPRGRRPLARRADDRPHGGSHRQHGGADRLGARGRHRRGHARGPAVPRGRRSRMAGGTVATDPAPGGCPARLPGSAPARRQRLHRGLRRRDGVRPLLAAPWPPRDEPQRGCGRRPRGRDLGGLRGARRQRDAPRRHLAGRRLCGAEPDGHSHGPGGDRAPGDGRPSSDRRLHGLVRPPRPRVASCSP